MMEDIFKPPDVQQPSHLVSDIVYWKNQYKLLGNACFAHNKAIEKVIENNGKYMVKIREEGAFGKEERHFYKEMKLFQEILRHQMNKLRNDSHEYLELEKNLKRFSDDPSLRITKLDNSYKFARDRLASQTKIVEDLKRDYHKSMFSIEKTNIKSMLATKSDDIYETKAKLEELEDKATIQLTAYTKHLEKWQNKFDRLQQISDEFENSYLKREEARSIVILSSLQKSVEMTNPGILAKRDAAFTSVNGKSVIKEKVIQKETIPVPVFEDYVNQEDTSETYAKARAEVEQEEHVTSVDRTGLMDNSEKDAEIEEFEKRLAANKMLKQLRKVRLHLVTKVYERQGVNQINLKVGEYVKMLLPENEEGFAFGQVVHGLLHKKKKGFYPVSHVTSVEREMYVEEEGGCGDNAYQIDRRVKAGNKRMGYIENDIQTSEDIFYSREFPKSKRKDTFVEKKKLQMTESKSNGDDTENNGSKKHSKKGMLNVVSRSSFIQMFMTKDEDFEKSGDATIQEGLIHLNEEFPEMTKIGKDESKDGTHAESNKKSKKRVFSMFANSTLVQKLKGKKSKKEDIDCDVISDMACNNNCNSENSFTEVMAFIPEPDNDDEGYYYNRTRQNTPKNAWGIVSEGYSEREDSVQEKNVNEDNEWDTSNGFKQQFHEGNTNARKKRRERKYKRNES